MESPDYVTSLLLVNLTLTASPLDVGPSFLATRLGASLMSIFLALGLLGNVLVMAAILCNRRVWNVINLFIVSLAINDILTYALIVLLIIQSYVYRAWSAGDVMCKLNPELTVLFTGCSLWHTALIAIHRNIVVCHNSLYRGLSKTGYVVFVLVAARAIPMLCVLPGFSLQTSQYQPNLLRCILKPSQGARIAVITTLLILLPCGVLLLCYSCVCGFVTRMRRRMTHSDMMLKREVQITKMFGVVFIMILLGFLPYTALRIVDAGSELHPDAYVIVTVVYAIATCSNPLVYGAMSTEIRRACAALLARLRARPPTPTPSGDVTQMSALSAATTHGSVAPPGVGQTGASCCGLPLLAASSGTSGSQAIVNQSLERTTLADATTVCTIETAQDSHEEDRDVMM